jgi:hypothetical protein
MVFTEYGIKSMCCGADVKKYFDDKHNPVWICIDCCQECYTEDKICQDCKKPYKECIC